MTDRPITKQTWWLTLKSEHWDDPQIQKKYEELKKIFGAKSLSWLLPDLEKVSRQRFSDIDRTPEDKALQRRVLKAWAQASHRTHEDLEKELSKETLGLALRDFEEVYPREYEALEKKLGRNALSRARLISKVVQRPRHFYEAVVALQRSGGDVDKFRRALSEDWKWEPTRVAAAVGVIQSYHDPRLRDLDGITKDDRRWPVVSAALKKGLTSEDFLKACTALEIARNLEMFRKDLQKRGMKGEAIATALTALCEPAWVLKPPPPFDDGDTSPDPESEIEELMRIMDSIAKIEDAIETGKLGAERASRYKEVVSDSNQLTRSTARELWRQVAEHPESPNSIAWCAFVARRLLTADDNAARRESKITRAVGLKGKLDEHHDERRLFDRAVDQQLDVDMLDDSVAPGPPTEALVKRSTGAAIRASPDLQRLLDRKALHKMRKRTEAIKAQKQLIAELVEQFDEPPARIMARRRS